MKNRRILYHLYGIVNGLACVLYFYFLDKVPYCNILEGVFWTIPLIAAIFGGYVLYRILISISNKKIMFSLFSVFFYFFSFALFSTVFDIIDRYFTQIGSEDLGGEAMLFIGTFIYYTFGFIASYIIAFLLWRIKSNRKV